MLTVIVLTATAAWGVISSIAAVLVGSMISLRDVAPLPLAAPGTLIALHAEA